MDRSHFSTTSLSVLVNGERLNEFASSRGIRQGDSLSPYIFILCIEYLVWLIHIEVDAGNWTGVKTSRFGPSFAHLYFADDLVLFAKATRKNCQAISRALGTFCNLLGQKVNLSKSSIFVSPHANPNQAPMLERELGFKIQKDFGKYLGVPILVDGRNTRAYDFLIEKIWDKLAGWKARTLSLAGRCTLINAVTTAIPTHVM